MASRCKAISRPAINLFKSTVVKPSSRPVFSVQSTRATPSLFPRAMPQMGALQSLLPLHSALSSARLTSCLGIDNCRSLSQEENTTYVWLLLYLAGASLLMHCTAFFFQN